MSVINSVALSFQCLPGFAHKRSIRPFPLPTPSSSSPLLSPTPWRSPSIFSLSLPLFPFLFLSTSPEHMTIISLILRCWLTWQQAARLFGFRRRICATGTKTKTKQNTHTRTHKRTHYFVLISEIRQVGRFLEKKKVERTWKKRRSRENCAPLPPHNKSVKEKKTQYVCVNFPLRTKSNGYSGDFLPGLVSLQPCSVQVEKTQQWLIAINYASPPRPCPLKSTLLCVHMAFGVPWE